MVNGNPSQYVTGVIVCFPSFVADSAKAALGERAKQKPREIAGLP